MMLNECWQKLAPPPLEMAFCEFMLDTIGDEALMSMAREFLPSKVFGHKFIQRLCEAWKAPGANRDSMRAFRGALPICYDAKPIEFRMNLSSDLRRLYTVSWNRVVEIVKRYGTSQESPK